MNTSDPDYYRWTQWIFLELFKAGLAYRDTGWQWWCPKDKTVLANEQVVDGKCERCGSKVTKKELTQWYFKITAYADELVEGLEDLDWPEPIKAMQRNWIGRSEGAEVTFASDAGGIAVYTTRPDTLFGATYLVLAPEHELVGKLTTKEQAQAVRKYVERAKRQSDIARTATDRKKTGVFTGSYATNPLNNEQVPVWVADYVLASYGTGAIMAVPAHDSRDREFAETFDLPVRQVVMPETGTPVDDEEPRQSIVAIIEHPKTGKLLTLDWKKGGGILFVGGGRDADEDPEAAARREIAEETGYKNLELVARDVRAKNHYHTIAHGKARCSTAELLHFRLRDEARDEPKLEAHEQGLFETGWMAPDEVEKRMTDPMHGFAFRWFMKRESLGGEGILVNSEAYDGLTSAEARERIVADLRKRKAATEQTGYKLRDWLISRQRYWGTPIPIIHCKKCGPQPVPESDLPVELPQIEDYLPTGDGRSPLAKVGEFVKTTCPQCGAAAERETDTMDTFADSNWYFLRYPSPHKKDAPFDKAALKAWMPVDTYVGGAEHAVLHLLYARFWTKALADRGHFAFREPFRSLRNQGLIMAPDGQKMSKSRGNVINPDEIVEGLGADTLRVFEMFIGPFDQAADWSTKGIEGSYRFLKRVWAFGQHLAEARAKTTTETEATTDGKAGPSDTEFNRVVSRATERVTDSVGHFRFNTAISALMEALNAFQSVAERAGGVPVSGKPYFERYLVLLAPFAPHLAEELWQVLGHPESIFNHSWPEIDRAALAEATATIVVQVNGKVRATVRLPAAGLTESAVVKAAQADGAIKKYLGTAKPKQAIYVPGKLLNFVI